MRAAGCVWHVWCCAVGGLGRQWEGPPEGLTQSRGGESFKVAIIGDSQSGAVSFDRLLREIDDVKPNLAIHLGDVVQDADVVREWHSYFFRPLEFRGLSNRIPWIVARGNHDIINKQRVFPNRGNGTSGPAPIFVQVALQTPPRH